jgi:hypothetical protein
MIFVQMNNKERDRGTVRDRRSSGLNLGSSEYEEGLDCHTRRITYRHVNKLSQGQL